MLKLITFLASSDWILTEPSIVCHGLVLFSWLFLQSGLQTDVSFLVSVRYTVHVLAICALCKSFNWFFLAGLAITKLLIFVDRVNKFFFCFGLVDSFILVDYLYWSIWFSVLDHLALLVVFFCLLCQLVRLNKRGLSWIYRNGFW